MRVEERERGIEKERTKAELKKSRINNTITCTVQAVRQALSIQIAGQIRCENTDE